MKQQHLVETTAPEMLHITTRALRATKRISASTRPHTAIAAARTYASSNQSSSSTAAKDEPHPERATEQAAQDTAAKKDHTKTQAQLDEELRQKMSGISGDGGDAGVEYEDGQPVSMKRSVKNNMFRYI